MLTHKVIKAENGGGKGGGVHSRLQYLMSTEYYRDPDGRSEAASRWWGDAAGVLGLKGKVELKDMDAVGRGFAPDGRKLVQSAGRENVWCPYLDENGEPKLDKDGKERGRFARGHEVGIDFVFSAPKPISVMYAGADDTERARIRQAHQDAVDDVMTYMQGHAETRRGKGSKEVIGAKLVVSAHCHHGSRSLDPDLHHHMVIYNVCLGEDGRWGALDSTEFLRREREYGAMYRAALAYRMRGLGYGVEKRVERDALGEETGDVYVGINGVAKGVEDEFSKRRQAILAYIDEHGGSAQQACLRTRKPKEEPPLEELVLMWGLALDDMRRRDPQIFKDVVSLKGRPDIGLSDTVPVEDNKILLDLGRNDAVWTRSALMERLALEHVGRLDVEGLQREADDFLSRNNIIELKPEAIHMADRGQRMARRHTEDNYAHREWVLGREQELQGRWKSRQDDQAVRVDKDLTDQVVAGHEAKKGVRLSDEQRDAVARVTHGSGGTVVITGVAGSGKTYTSEFWINVFKADGREVIGAAVAWDAAKKLQADSGITSHSTKWLLTALDKGKMVLNERSVVVLDEAGMAGTETVLALQRHCDAAKAKLVLQGDALQLQPIEAGAPFRQAVETLGDARLTEIRRQQHQQDRDTAQAFYAADGSLRSRAQNRVLGVTILERLEKAGQIEGYATHTEAIENLAHDYLTSQRPDRDKLVMAGPRTDVDALNKAIRTGKQQRGQLGAEEHVLQTVDRNRAATLPVAVGERLRFGKKEDKIGVVNGNVGVVESVRTRADAAPVLHVRLESDIASDNGRRVEVDTATYPHLTHAYASTVHRAQGLGKEEVFQLASVGMTDRHLALVGFTRTKQKFALYGADEAVDPDRMAERWGRDRLKVNALDRLKPEPLKPKRQTPEHSPSPSRSKQQRSGQGVKANVFEDKRGVLERLGEKLAQATGAEEKKRVLFGRLNEVWRTFVHAVRPQAQEPEIGPTQKPAPKPERNGNGHIDEKQRPVFDRLAEAWSAFTRGPVLVGPVINQNHEPKQEPRRPRRDRGPRL